MSAAKRFGSAPQIDRSPSSGVRLRVRPDDDRSSLDAIETPALAVTGAPERVRVSFYNEGELAPEDAVPFSGNTAITAVFAFCMTAAGMLVAAGFYL
ncbi:MAG: hypothetical protein HOV80_24840 [Polyangiaceae bacterium]|nr:hypothetical protein [Polyangiaceae bacterium]